MFRVTSLFILATLAVPSLTLTCYENDDQGNVYERSNSSWNYCSLIPFANPSTGGRLAGVGPSSENTEGYDATFGQSSALYKVLTLCIYEKYDFGAINPKLGSRPEFMFRCFCNYDRCNSATTFSHFLGAVRKDNM